MPIKPMRLLAVTLIVVVATAVAAHAETKTIARCGAGFLEDENGYRYWLFRSGHYDTERTYQWFIHGFFA